MLLLNETDKDDLVRQIQKDMLTKLIELNPPSQDLLDVGCGNGYFTRIIASTLPRTQIFAVDSSSSKLPQNQGPILYSNARVEALPFSSETFDTVVACMSFHHWNSKQDGLHEVFRVLKPGGTLIIGDPFFEGIMRNRFAAWLLQVTDGGKFTSFDDFNSYISEAGFEHRRTLPVSGSFGTMFVVSMQKPDNSH